MSCSSKRNRLVGSCINTLVSSTKSLVLDSWLSGTFELSGFLLVFCPADFVLFACILGKICSYRIVPSQTPSLAGRAARCIELPFRRRRACSPKPLLNPPTPLPLAGEGRVAE